MVSALVCFPAVLLATVIHAGIKWPRWAAFSGFIAGWWFPDFLQALVRLGSAS